MRLQPVRRPDALHRAQADADRLGHRPAGPVGGLTRRFRAGERQHPGHGRKSPAAACRAAGTCRAADRPHPARHSAAASARRRPAHPGAARHLGHRQSIRREQNNPSPLYMLERAAPITGDSGQSRAVPGSHDHADILCHAHRLACLREFVNPMFASVH